MGECHRAIILLMLAPPFSARCGWSVAKVQYKALRADSFGPPPSGSYTDSMDAHQYSPGGGQRNDAIDKQISHLEHRLQSSGTPPMIERPDK